MLRIQCIDCKKIIGVMKGRESEKWFHHKKQTKCEKEFSIEITEVENQKDIMSKELEIFQFVDHQNEMNIQDFGSDQGIGDDIDDGEANEVELLDGDETPGKIYLGDFSEEILDLQERLAGLGVNAAETFASKVRSSHCPDPDVSDLMEILKFGVDCHLSRDQGDKLMKLLSRYSTKHVLKVNLPTSWRTMEDCIEKSTEGISFVKKYVRPLEEKFFGKYNPDKPESLLETINGFMLNLKVVVGKMFLEMDVCDFNSHYVQDTEHDDEFGRTDRLLSSFSTGDLAKKFHDASKNYVYEVEEGAEDVRPVDVFINISFDETSVSKVGSTSLTPTYFSIMNCSNSSYKYEVGGYIPYKLPHDDTFLKVCYVFIIMK